MFWNHAIALCEKLFTENVFMRVVMSFGSNIGNESVYQVYEMGLNDSFTNCTDSVLEINSLNNDLKE